VDNRERRFKLQRQRSATAHQDFVNFGPQTVKIGPEFLPICLTTSQLSGTYFCIETCYRHMENRTENHKGFLHYHKISYAEKWEWIFKRPLIFTRT